MTGHERLLIIILVCNTLVALIYLVCNLLRKKVKNRGCVFRTIVMILCPLVGPCFFLLSYLLFRIFFSRPVDLSDVIFGKERVATFVHAEENERNLVPMEEAIEITDTENLRSLMMNVVRGDIQKSLAAISLALNSSDTETAHYAASVLQDALNDFRMNVQKQYQMILSQDDFDASQTEMLLDYMDQVLAQHVFTDMEQKTYVQMMDQICEVLFVRDRGRMTSPLYEAVSLRLLEVEDFYSCEKWCERAAGQYPNSLATYTCQLKLFFNSGQKTRFFEVIEDLRNSLVVLDSETLELIRVFL